MRVDPTRGDDDRILTILSMREAGTSGTEIGALFDLRGSYVRTIIQRVERDYAASER